MSDYAVSVKNVSKKFKQDKARQMKESNDD